MTGIVVEWVCDECMTLNRTHLEKWKVVRDGQGYEDVCGNCYKRVDVDIDVKVKVCKG